MAKRTFAFVAVFAALLSVTLSVQAQETLTDYYWSGGASDNLYYTIGNWKLDDTHPASTPLNDNDSSTDNTIRLNLYGNQNLNISLNYTHLGSNVKKLIIGGGTYTTKLTRSSTGILTVAANKSIEIVNNGTLQVDSTLFLNANAALSVKDNGTFALKGFETAGTFDYSSSKDFRIADGVDAIVKITGGEATINADTHVGIGYQTGTINQSGGNVTFYKNLNLGWVNTSDGSGHYILSGGTLTTKANAGLWNNYNNGAANTFTMTGGTANFQQTGESFAIGANNNTNIVKNVFNLYSGTVNATDTFAIKHSGTLKVAQNAVEDPETHEVTVTGGDGVLNAKGITLTTGGILDMSSGTINVGESGITSSDGSYSINLSGGTLGTNGASWSSALTANIASGSAVTFNPDSGKTITWSGVLKDAGGVTKTGAGTLTLSGANTYSGGTTISAGTLAISNANGLGTGAVTINGGKLDSSAAVMNVANSFVVGENGGAITAKTGDYSSFSSISGSGDLTTNGYVNFNGTGGYNGHITVKSGYTRINNSNVFGVFDLTIDGGHFNVLNSGTIKIGKLNGSESSYYLFGASENNEYVFEIGYGTESTDSATYGSAIRGSNTTNGNVTIKKVGEGTQTFNRGGWGYSSSDNKHSIKAVIVDEGKMIIDANNTTAFQGGKTEGYWGYAPITVNSGATLEYVRAWTTSPNVLMTINSGTLTLDTVQYQNKMVLNSATINGAGNLQVGHKGDGEWTVKGGTSTINNNFVIVKTDNVNKTFTINFDAGATLDIKKGMSGMSGHTGTNVIFKGTGNAPGNIIIEAQSGDMSGLGNLTFDNMNGSIAAVYSGTGSLTKSGAGTVTLSGANTYTGATTISGGTLEVNNNFTSSSGLAGSGTLKLSGSEKYFNIGDASGFTGTVQVFDTSISGQSRVYLAGANGTTSTNINLSNATVEINGNTSGKFSELTFFKGGSTLSIGTLNGNAYGRILNLDSSNTAAYNNLTVSEGTFAGQIGRSDASGDTYAYVNKINLTKVGDGTFTLSGMPYYFGETNIQGGVLKFVNNNISTNKHFDRSNALKGSGTLQIAGNTDNWVLFAINANASSPQEFSGLLDVSGNFVFYQNTNLGNATLHVAEDSYATMHGGNTKNLTVKELNTESGSKVRISHASPGAGNFATLTVGSGTVNGDLGEIANNAYYNWVKLNKVSDGSEDGGRLTLAGAFLYTGETTVSGGVLELTGDAVVANGPVSIGTNGTLVYNVDGQDKYLEITEDNANAIFGTGKIIKTGEGTLKIYSDAENMIDVQSLTVSSGRVDIKEYFNGKLIVDSEGTFSPGNSVGTLTIDNFTVGETTYGGGFILNEAGAELLMEIGGADPGANDGLIVNGDITFKDGSIITLVNNSNLGRGESFTAILSASNSDTLKVLDHIQTSDFTYLKYETVTYLGNTVYAITGRTFNANEVPEPSTWALLILGAAGLLYWRKRK